MTTINLYPEMNEKIADILRLGGSFGGMYAAARIEQLEAELTEARSAAKELAEVAGRPPIYTAGAR